MHLIKPLPVPGLLFSGTNARLQGRQQQCRIHTFLCSNLISGTGKYDRGLSWLLHDELHWLDIPQRVQYKLAVTVHRYVSGVKHRRTFPITGFPSLKSLVASTYDPPDANNWMYHASAVLSVVAPLHSPVRQSGIHCRIIFAIRL